MLEEEPFETMENIEIKDINQYLETVLNRRSIYRQSCVNFMESQKMNFI
jgi:hypothetical protein